MNKSVLVIDTPLTCNSCPCLDTTDIVKNGGEYAFCWATYEAHKKSGIIMIKRPKQCPLRPLPQKNKGCLNYAVGWNDCLKEILGEEDGNN